jgi:flagellar secretion chaperone FliS
MYAQEYVENDLLDKSPVELIRLLYSKAIEKLQLALRYTGAGDVRERNNCLARVMEIVAELQGALNREAGGELALELARLYDYVQRQLIEAAAEPAEVARLEQVRVLFGNLYDGWRDCEPPPPPEAGDSAGDAPGAAVEQRSESGGDEEFSIEQMPAPADCGGQGGERVWTL